MPSIFEKIALKVLSHYLDNYINPIQSSQLKLALATGNAELNNVSIKSTALSVHHLPFTVTSGIIQSIKLHFPWKSLKKEPCIIEIDGIHIIANFSKDVQLKSELEIKESVLKELEDAGLSDEKVKNVLFQGTISQVISNIIIRVKNVHIRVEMSTPDPNTFFAFGVMFKQIECFSIGEKGEQTFVQPDANIAKRIQIQDFSIYADPQPEKIEVPTSLDKIEEYLQIRDKEKHEYILDSFSFSSDYIMTKNGLQTHSKMANQIDQIYFKVTQRQMAFFGEYTFQFNSFSLRQKYSIFGRPNHPPTEDDDGTKLAQKWWHFLHQCTIEKRYPNRINIPDSILILKTRSSYYNIWKIRQSMSIQDFKRNLNYSKLKKIEEKLPLNSILFLRNYSNYRISKEKASKTKLVLDKSDLDILTSSTVFETSADISLLINKIKVKIYENAGDAKPILTFAAHELDSKFIQSLDKTLNLTVVCKSLKIYSIEKVIFHQDSIDRSSFEVNYQFDPKKKEEKVDIVASQPFINIDLKFLYKLKLMLYDDGFNKCPSSSSFSFSRTIADLVTEEANKCTPFMIHKGQYADVILQKKCDEFSFMKLKMKLLSPTVKIQGARLSFQMKEIDLESFPIHERFANQVETLYFDYLLKCTDFTIGLGENEILKPVTIDLNFGVLIAPVEWLDKFRMALNISSIAVVFNKESFSEIISGIGQLLKLSQDFEQTETGKVLAQKLETPKSSYIENLNMENLSTNYATKVSITFNNISLELDTVGRFDILNFETQIAVGSNGLGLNLRVKNIICNSLENKYIFFDVNENESENHFLKENNAIVCQFTLFFDKAMKLNMSVNSPTIIIDFGWIESTLDFFKCADIKSLILSHPPQPLILNEAEIDIIESVMTNSIEFQLLKPTFKAILPAFNKFKDDVELTLNLDYITFGQTDNQSNGKKSMLLKMPTFSFEWKKRLTATINNFSVLIGEKISLYCDGLTVFDILENKTNIDIKSLKQKEDDSFIDLKIDKDKIETTINDFNLIFDINSYMIPELVLSLLKSSAIAKIISSFIDETEISQLKKVEEEESSKTKPKKSVVLNVPNANVVLIDNEIKLNSHLAGTFTISPQINHAFFSELTIFFSEKELDFAPILNKVSLEFGLREKNLIFSLDKTKAFISPSDVIDTMNFVNKIMKLFSDFSHQLDYSKSNFEEEINKAAKSNPIESVCIANNQVVLEFCEDNRIAEIQYPFVRLTINPNSAKASLKQEPSFLLLSFQIEIYNKTTQRWDLLIEPLKIYLSFSDTKHYNIEIKDRLNIVVSHAILNQICQFKFERQSINNNNVLPCFIIENNTREICEFIFKNENDNIMIPPQCISALRKVEPFKFMGMTIDPLNFYSPQFISNKYSLSIFFKGKERFISISSPLLLKNKSNINLLYQEKHTGNVVELYARSITPLFKLAAEFGIYGKNPKQTPQAINLFKLKERSKIYIPVFVEDKTFYFFLSIKFSNKRGIVMLTLTPNYKIRNNYKLPIIFTVDAMYQKITIQGKSTEYLNHAGFDSSFNFFIEANDHVSQSSKLELKNNTFIPVTFTPNSAFSLRYDNGIITLQPPLLAKNLTDLPVTIFDYQNNQIVTLQTKNSEDFIGPPDFFKDGKIQLSIQIEGYEKSELFDATIGHQKIFLKSLSSDFYIPIALLFSMGATGIIHLRIDHLVYIRNESIEKLQFQPVNSDQKYKLEIDPEQTKAVLLGTTDLKFMFNIENNENEIEINLRNTFENRNQFATLTMDQTILSVDFQTSSTLAGHFVVIKDCVFPQPLVLTNLLGEKNPVEQIDVVVHCGFPSQIIIKPMSTGIISSRDLVGQNLKVYCYTQCFEVDLTKFTEVRHETIETEEIKIDIYFKLVCLENGSHMIIVSNEVENKVNRFNLLSIHEISFGLAIPFISVNFIDDQMRELSLIGFQNTSIKCQFTKDTVEMLLQIDLFQIDDMYPDTIVPVAVFNSSPPFISLRMIKENANMIFDLIELKLKPLTFYIDINYIAELFNFFTTIKMKEKDDTIDVKASSNKSSIPILIKQIYIDKVNLNVSASSQTGRPTFHPFPYEFILDYIPSVTDVNLGRKEFNKTDLSSDNKVLKKMLKDYYNPLVRDIKSLVAARSFAFVFKGISNAFHKIGDSSKIDVSFNQEKGKVIQRSFQSFGKGILNGVTGIVMKPVKGLKKDGAKGFFVGLGKGVSGIITDPVAGLIDAGAGIIDEVKNSLSESRDSMRFPRVFNNIQVQEYDNIGAICQLQYQRYVKNYEDKFVYFVNGNDKFIGITQTNIAYLVPNDQKKNPSKKFAVKKLRSIADIKNVSPFEKDLIIMFNDESVIEINCQSTEIAEMASKIVVSRSYYSNYRNNTASMSKMASSDLSSSTEIEEKEIKEQQLQKQKDAIIKDGFYSIKCSNGKFWSNDKEFLPLLANRDKAKGWEKFQITNNDDGTISFLSNKNKKYVKVGNSTKLFASSTTIGTDEKFSVNPVGENRFNFISMKTGQYVSADRNKLTALYANRTEAKGWERFELIPRD